MKHYIFLLSILFLYTTIFAQNNSVLEGRGPFSKADSTRGYLNAHRSFWRVSSYDLNLAIDIQHQEIRGYNKVVAFLNFAQPEDSIQIDLFGDFIVDSVVINNKKCSFRRLLKAIIVKSNFHTIIDAKNTIIIYYHGKPREAPHPPWKGGFVWRKDKKGNPWVGVACEGLGASSWWPLKDHLSNEPDSMRIAISVPDPLVCVSNGQLRSKKQDPNNNANTIYEWFVSYPINSYNVTLNIGDYAYIKDSYKGLNGNLDLDYYVLSYNKKKAKNHFKQVKRMLDCFEEKLGPYPFYRDGYALVETDYWGMEHQGAIAYGNKYSNNEFDFDYIIVHESGHEWFGNNISCSDHAELWIHESFTTYTETMLVECWKGRAEADRYILTQRPKIRNLDPILGPLDVNFDDWKSSDMYYKGAWMIHTLRSVVNDEQLWGKTIRGMYDAFRLKNTTTDSIVSYFNRSLKSDYTHFFDQYLKYKNLPTFIYQLRKISDDNFELTYRWKADVSNFRMPVDIFIGNIKQRLFPTTQPQTVRLSISNPKDFKLDTDHFLIEVKSE